MGTSKRSIGTRTNIAANMADLACVDRVNSIYHDPSSFSFIGNEALQLVEAPIAEPVIHFPASPQLPYPFKVFHYNPVSIKAGNNILADIVVIPSHKPLFFSREIPKKPSAGMSAFGLQFTTQVSEFPFNLLDFTAVIEPAVRSDSNVIYAEVNAKNPMITRACINLFSKSKQEESSAFSIYSEQAFLDLPIIEILPIAIRNIKSKGISLADSSYGKNITFELGTSWEVVSDACSVDDWLASSFLNHACCLLDAGNCQLSWQSLPPQGVIDEWMQSDIIPNLAFPSLIDTELQSLAVSLDCPDYLWSGWNLDFGYSPSNHAYIKSYKHINLTEDWLPKAEAMGILYL